MIRNVGSPVARVVGKRVFRPGYPTPEVSDISLQAVEASTVFDLDATIAESYPGEGSVWKNLVAAPADGADQDDYDFTTFFGGNNISFVADGQNSHWLWDTRQATSDDFRVSTNTAFLNGLHRTDNTDDFWAAYALYDGHNAGSTQSRQHFGNQGASNNNAGLRLQTSASTTSQSAFLVQRGDSAASDTNFAAQYGNTPVTHLIILSHNKTTNKTTVWIGGAPVEYDLTFAAATANPAALFSIGSRGEGNANSWHGGSKLYSFAMGNEYLDNTKAAAIIAALEERHNRSYS